MRTILPLLLAVAAPGFAQLSPTATWATHAANEYQMYPNVTYLTMGDTQLKMDIYRRRTATTPQPTIIYMHGGFWVAGNKEAAILNVLPWMEMGWNVVNVEYRLGPNTLAPGALEDSFCALRYVGQQAKTYNVDVDRIVVTGESAGGHLALALGIIPESEGFDRECAANTPLPKVAAVINWFGIADVPDVIDGPNRRPPAERWFGSLPNRMEIAKRVSPMTYVRAGSAAHPDRPRGCGSDGAVSGSGRAACGADQGERSQPADHGPGRPPWGLHVRAARSHLPDDPGVPGEERARPEVTGS